MKKDYKKKSKDGGNEAEKGREEAENDKSNETRLLTRAFSGEDGEMKKVGMMKRKKKKMKLLMRLSRMEKRFKWVSKKIFCI